MAKKRMINTCFWSDPFIQELKTDEKLLYLYLLTNERTSICGIYEVTKRTICFDTGLTEHRLQQIVDRLVQSGKLRTHKNWYYIINFAKHQQNNPSILQGIERAKKELPGGLIDTLGTEWVQSGTLEPEAEPELEPELEEKVANKFDDESREVQLSKILMKKILKNNPTHKFSTLSDSELEKTIQSYGGEINKMFRLDNRTYEQIEILINWSQQDSFWQSNILSMPKLRKQFDTLAIQMKTKEPKNNNIGVIIS